jgi:hypothetical protein
MMQIIFGLKKITEFKGKILKLSHLFFSKYTCLNCLKKLQKIKIDLYKEPLSNSGKNES